MQIQKSIQSLTFEQILTFVATLVLAMVLLFAAIAKTLEPQTFISFVNALFGISMGVSKIVLILVVVVEFGIGASLLLWYKRPVPYIASGIAFLVFFGVIGAALIIDLEASCGCFGGYLEAQNASVPSLVRNAALACVSITLANWN
jgi:hypothetical protein